MDTDGSKEVSGSSTAQAEVEFTRADRRRHRTHQALLEAGVQVVAGNGLHGLTISTVTEAADVGLGTFYNHFDDRNQFLRALFAVVLDQWVNAIHETRVRAFESEAEQLCATVMTLIRRSRLQPAWGMFLAEVLAAEELTRGAVLEGMIQPSLQRGAVEGTFAIEDSELGARLTIGLIRQSLLHIGVNGATDGLEFTIARVVLQSLGTAPHMIDLAVRGASDALGFR